MSEKSVVIRNLRFTNPNEHPANLEPGQIAFNIGDPEKFIYIGDGSETRVNHLGQDLSGSLDGTPVSGKGWVSYPLKGGVTDAALDARDTENRARANHTGTQAHTTISDWDDFLAGTENVTEFTPTSDYHPATKKYVDDEVSSAASYTDENAQDAVGGILTPEFTYSDETPSISINTISADKITDGSTNKAYTAGEQTKLSGIATGATANDTDANLKNRANHTGTQSHTTISDWDTELAGTANTSAFTPTTDYHPATKKYVDDAIVGAGGYNDEQAQDAVGGILTSEFTYNDATPSISVNTISADKIVDGSTNKVFTGTEKTKLSGIATGATANDTDANLKNRANHTGTQTASTISDFASAVSSNATVTAKANIASPTFTGTPAAPTASVGTNTTQLATTAFVQSQIASRFTRGVTAVAALNIDCSLGNYFTKTISGNSTFTFSNPPSSGTAYAFTLELTHTSGTVTWPASVKWPASTAPTLTTSKVHLFIFLTDDGGTNWRASSLVDY